MRNRGIEIYLDSLQMESMHELDLHALLYQGGFKILRHRKALVDIHCAVSDVSPGPEQPTMNHLLQAAFLSIQNWKRGLSLFLSVKNAFSDIYLKSRSLPIDHKMQLHTTLEEAIEQHKIALTNENVTLQEFFLSKQTTLSTLSLQNSSSYATVRQQGTLLFSYIKACELSLKMKRSISALLLKDIIGSDLKRLSLDPMFGLDYKMLDTVPFIVISFYKLATSLDIHLRHSWLEDIVRNVETNQITQKIFVKILDISSLVSRTILGIVKKSDLPWELRHISNKLMPKGARPVYKWSEENKMIALVCYNVIMGSSADNAQQFEIPSRKSNWGTMSAIEYSQAVHQGKFLSEISVKQVIQ
jgi:hypothetical protein